MKENLLIMRGKPSLNRNITSEPLYHSTGPSIKIFVRILFAFRFATLFLLNDLFCYLVMCKFMCTTVRVNGTVQIYFILGHEIEHYHCHKLWLIYCNFTNQFDLVWDGWTCSKYFKMMNQKYIQKTVMVQFSLYIRPP